MPRVIDGLPTAETPLMAPEDLTVLAQDDVLGISVHVHRPTNRPRLDAVTIVIETHQAGLGDGGGLVAVTIERAAIGNKGWALGFKDLDDCSAGLLGMGFGARIGEAVRLQPTIQLCEAFESAVAA